MSLKKNLNLGPSEKRARRRRLFWVRFYIILFFTLIILFTLAILSGHEKVTIKTFLISGNNSVLNSQILEIANQDIAGRYFGLFAKRNTLIFPRHKISRDILSQIKIIKDVDVSWKDWQTVTIKVSERKPHSVYCGSDIKAIDSSCYFIDQTGYIFGRAPVFSGNIFIKNYTGLENPEPINQYFLPTTLYQKIFALIQSLGQKNLIVRAVTFDKVDFRFYLNTGQIIIFNDKEGGFDQAFQNLSAALDSNELDLSKEGNLINYIDLRFDSKIVIGKKNENK